MARAISVPEASMALTTKAPRLDGVDLLRGLVMVLMVLDHTRDYFTATSFDPTVRRSMSASSIGCTTMRAKRLPAGMVTVPGSVS